MIALTSHTSPSCTGFRHPFFIGWVAIVELGWLHLDMGDCCRRQCFGLKGSRHASFLYFVMEQWNRVLATYWCRNQPNEMGCHYVCIDRN